MVNIQKKALEQMWKDRCTVYHREEITDPVTKITSLQETPLLEDQPCKLSFESLASTDQNHAAAVSQSVKLFLSSDVVIPAGCKIVVRRLNPLKREFTYFQSGEAGVFTNHQEIILTLWKGWA